MQGRSPTCSGPRRGEPGATCHPLAPRRIVSHCPVQIPSSLSRYTATTTTQIRDRHRREKREERREERPLVGPSLGSLPSPVWWDPREREFERPFAPPFGRSFVLPL